MKEQELLALLPYLLRYGVLFLCTLFGLGARESLDSIKAGDNYKFRKAIPKVILGFFVCVVTLPFLEQIELIKKTFPIPAILISFMYMPVANFLNKDLIPFILQMYTKKGGKDV
nr:hypothetical protein [uncultured Pedobacter sp.]